jgi:hypothetical protein
MKCRECGKEIKDNILICPECGTIQKVEKKGPHYNYANDGIKRTVTKLTDEIYDEEYEQRRKKDVSIDLLKNKVFWIVNIIYIILVPILIYVLLRKYELAMLFAETCVPFWIISVISYQFMFNKAGKKWYMGLIPLIRIITLLQIRNEERIKDQLQKCEPVLIVWLFLAILYYGGGRGSYWMVHIGYMAFCTLIYTIGLHIWYRITVLKELAARFNNGSDKNKILTIIFPFIMIMCYGFLKKYKYTKLKDSYL